MPMSSSETPAEVSRLAPAETPASTHHATARAPTLRDYAHVTLGLLTLAVVLTVLVRTGSGAAVQAGQVIAPLLALSGLIGAVLLTTLVTRNYAVLSGLCTGRYFYRFDEEPPPEWVERPARVFNNLMQMPPMFYLVCALMLVTGRMDAAQLYLAWVFVALRCAHALVYGIWNHLPSRFGTFLASAITLGVIYVRFADQTADLWRG